MNRPAPTLAVTGSNLAIGKALVAVLLIAGCQAPAAPFDPFLAGRNTIPPPGTAVPAASAPYYNAAPPTVTVPAPGATYTAPGAIPAAPLPTSVPPAGAGQFPRGISVPQSNNQMRGDGSQLAKWQLSDDAKTAATRTSSGASPRDVAGSASNVGLATASRDELKPRQDGGVVRASHEERNPEAPIRIVEPAAHVSAAAKSGDKASAGSARDVAASTSRGKAVPSRKLPELTDFPAAEPGFKPNTRP